MFVTTLAFIVSIALAGVAAWFSITGLMAIFAALPLSIAIMAGVLEVGKLITASILYRNWKILPFQLRTYLTTAVVVLMFITSLGIYGYLSKAHLDQNAPVSNNIAKIERLEQRIAREERTINDAETIIAQLDNTIATLIEYDKISGPDGARAVRENQEPQREELNSMIDRAQANIDEYLDEKFEYEQTVRDFETEVGPIKYIAALVYDNPEEHYDTAVRAVILLIIFVFDPLAVLLLITANDIQMRGKSKKEQEEETMTLDQVRDLIGRDTDPSFLPYDAQMLLFGGTFPKPDYTTSWERYDIEELENEQFEPPAPPPMPKNEDWKEHDVSTTKPVEDLGEIEEAFHNAEVIEEQPVEEPTEPEIISIDDDEVDISIDTRKPVHSVLAELADQPSQVLSRVIGQLTDEERRRPLTPTEQYWRNTARNILERRRRSNPLEGITRNDENIG